MNNTIGEIMISARSRSSPAGFDIDPRSRSSPPSGRPLRPPPLPPPSLSANARPALPRPSDAPPPSPEPPRHACAPRRRPERPSGPLRPASAPSAAATRVHRSRAAVMTGTPHGLTAPTRVATAVRSRVAPTARPRFDPLRLTAPTTYSVRSRLHESLARAERGRSTRHLAENTAG